jgi:hypothetical protein
MESLGIFNAKIFFCKVPDMGASYPTRQDINRKIT